MQMDFLRALLQPQFSETPALKPRVPALFEPLATRVDFASFEAIGETGTVNSARDENVARRAPQLPLPEISRTREPYRGVMNVPPIQDTAETRPSPSSQNNAPRAARPLDERAHELPNKRADQESHIEPRATRSVLVPTQIFQAQPREARDEKIQNTESQPAPIVRVSIGRIIVRAESSERSPQRSPLSQRSPAPSKKMSLDEYLQKRERGER